MKFVLNVTNYDNLSKEQIDKLHISFNRHGYITNKDGTRACVEISTLTELADFTNMFGDIIISCVRDENPEIPDEMHLEIYNDY